jgi:hypothetical protein
VSERTHAAARLPPRKVRMTRSRRSGSRSASRTECSSTIAHREVSACRSRASPPAAPR